MRPWANNALDKHSRDTRRVPSRTAAQHLHYPAGLLPPLHVAVALSLWTAIVLHTAVL